MGNAAGKNKFSAALREVVGETIRVKPDTKVNVRVGDYLLYVNNVNDQIAVYHDNPKHANFPNTAVLYGNRKSGGLFYAKQDGFDAKRMEILDKCNNNSYDVEYRDLVRPKLKLVIDALQTAFSNGLVDYTLIALHARTEQSIKSDQPITAYHTLVTDLSDAFGGDMMYSLRQKGVRNIQTIKAAIDQAYLASGRYLDMQKTIRDMGMDGRIEIYADELYDNPLLQREPDLVLVKDIRELLDLSDGEPEIARQIQELDKALGNVSREKLNEWCDQISIPSVAHIPRETSPEAAIRNAMRNAIRTLYEYLHNKVQIGGMQASMQKIEAPQISGGSQVSIGFLTIAVLMAILLYLICYGKHIGVLNIVTVAAIVYVGYRLARYTCMI